MEIVCSEYCPHESPRKVLKTQFLGPIPRWLAVFEQSLGIIFFKTKLGKLFKSDFEGQCAWIWVLLQHSVCLLAVPLLWQKATPLPWGSNWRERRCAELRVSEVEIHHGREGMLGKSWAGTPWQARNVSYILAVFFFLPLLFPGYGMMSPKFKVHYSFLIKPS